MIIYAPTADGPPPSYFLDCVPCVEGLGQSWMAMDHDTHRVYPDMDPFPPETINPFDLHFSTPVTAVPTFSNLPLGYRPLPAEPTHRATKFHPLHHPPPQRESEVYLQPGYPISSPPFSLFHSNDLIPIDLDPDIVWLLENEHYRAYRFSTLKADDGVLPNLTVGGEPPLSIWGYLEKLEMSRGEVEGEEMCLGVVDCGDDFDIDAPFNGSSDDDEGGDGSHCEDLEVSKGVEEVTGGHRDLGLAEYERLIQASMPNSWKPVEGQGLRVPSTLLNTTTLSEKSKKADNIIGDLPSPDRKVSKSATHGMATRSKRFSSTHQPATTHPAMSANPNSNRPSPFTIASENDLEGTNSKDEAIFKVPLLPSRQPSPLPSLPSRKDRMRIVQAFNHHAAVTFSIKPGKRCQRCSVKGKKGKGSVTAKKCGTNC
ncbi:MAG: hypothetical protein L6R41_002830 [Letrouitia leprolyta]|nr:MAG: hypothetical protein L6R41_002830 [Letrouitia leprolyta]